MPNKNYRPLTLADVEPAAQVIAQAFFNEPLIAFMLPIKATRMATLKKFFRAYGEINIKNNRGFGVGDPLQGVAYWEQPAQGSLSTSVKSLGIFLPLLFTMYPIGYFRARTIIEHTESMHKKYATEPHFYLDNLGVTPDAQGKGLSSKLIRPFLQMADEQKVIAYTDTVTESNVSFYKHFGFDCIEASLLRDPQITVYALRRTPR